jgi:glycosyltransferase involved in cell wall biosynthesis
VELTVVGKIAERDRKQVEGKTHVPVNWMGVVPRERIPEIDRSAHLLFSADLNAACPNSVIEALACGLPVLAFDTGALNELVTGEAGRVVPYGGNPWNIDPPDVQSLAERAVEILRDQPRFRRSAREQAEKNLGLDRMVDKYLEALLG